MTDKICEIMDLLKKQKPLIHCITNPISINQCANTILAIGAKPVMAEHPKEVCEITGTADSLMLNVGNITDVRMESIIISAETAKRKGIPFMLDIVGIACSNLRRKYVLNLIDNYTPFVIKGNYSEIVALWDEKYFAYGVDAEVSVNKDYVTDAAIWLAKKYKTVILATGKTDVITNGSKVMYIKNGTPDLTSVTGTGCMLGALCSAFMAITKPMEASVAACLYFGICGELSKTDKGNGTFMVNLLDKISTLSGEEILKHLKVEEIT